MSKIIVLDELTACQIAAGEVIERPSSVIKELAENSIDAGATMITVEIRSGGIKYIRITDNGCGFEADDAVIAFDKHATSKIKSGEDLNSVATLGFRGEALASIAAVADVELLSKTEDAVTGVYVHIKGCEVLETGERGAAKGTTITVRDLFYNTPARYKFLKKDSTEASYVADVMQKLAISNPNIAFKLIANGKEVFRTPGNGDLKSVIFSIYGKETAACVLPVDYQFENHKITGFTGIKDAVYSNRTRQIFYVNGRCIKSKTITAALDEAYKTVTMKNKFPFSVIMIEMPLTKVDVNVHPTKSEVRFSDESSIYRLVYHGITNALLYDNKYENKEVFKVSEPIQTVTAQTKSFSPQNITVPKIPEPVYVAPVQEFPKEEIELPPIWNIPSEVKEEKCEIPVAPEVMPLAPEPVKPNSEVKITPDIPAEQPVLYNSTSVYTDGVVVGQVFNTYIILQYGNEIVFIDQHAAHERIKYEEIKDAVNESTGAVSPMLVPISMQLSPAEYTALHSNMEFFEAMGFEIDDFGGNTVLIRAVPTILADSNIEDVILSGLQNKKTVGFSDEEIYTMACKAAVKANKSLSRMEIDELLQKLAKLENSGTCPHGRPICVSLTEHELERRFKRCL